MNKKIIIMLSVVMLLASPMAAYAYDTNNPAIVNVAYVANVDTSFSVAGGSTMTFNATKHCSLSGIGTLCPAGNPRNAKLVQPDNQNASIDDEYLTITNGATISQDFSAALNATVTGIQTKLGGTSDHTSAKNIGTIPTVILNNIAGGHSGRIFGWANFSASPVGSTSRQITLSSSEALVVTTIVVSPNPAYVTEGLSLTFSAIAYDQYDSIMPGITTFTWSDTPLNGSISLTGVYSGGVAGNTDTITAEKDGVSGTASLTVRAPQTLTSVGIASDPTIEASTSTTFTAIGYDQDGAVMAIPSGVTLTWSVVEIPALGSVSPSTGPTTTFTAGSTAGSSTVRLTATGIATPAQESIIIYTV